MNENYTLSDIASIIGNNGFGGNGGMFTLLLFVLLLGGGGGFGWNRNGDYGQFATAASQNEILFGQKFSDLDNKIDRIGNGIADATFALNNSIKDGNNMVAGTVVAEGRNIQNNMCEIKTAIHNEGEATRALIQQNKIEALQQKINSLEIAQQMCNVVRYPNGWTYNAGQSPFCGCNNGCCN